MANTKVKSGWYVVGEPGRNSCVYTDSPDDGSYGKPIIRVDDLLRAVDGPHGVGWETINTAPKDGNLVWIYTAMQHGLPPFEGPCAYHADAGWCTDELRPVTYWHPETTKMLRDAARYRWLIENHYRAGMGSVSGAPYYVSIDDKRWVLLKRFNELIDAEIAREKQS
jgi:hypothetical protein